MDNTKTNAEPYNSNQLIPDKLKVYYNKDRISFTATTTRGSKFQTRMYYQPSRLLRFKSKSGEDISLEIHLAYEDIPKLESLLESINN